MLILGTLCDLRGHFSVTQALDTCSPCDQHRQYTSPGAEVFCFIIYVLKSETLVSRGCEGSVSYHQVAMLRVFLLGIERPIHSILRGWQLLLIGFQLFHCHWESCIHRCHQAPDHKRMDIFDMRTLQHCHSAGPGGSPNSTHLQVLSQGAFGMVDTAPASAQGNVWLRAVLMSMSWTI